jgi:hypothetical protein
LPKTGVILRRPVPMIHRTTADARGHAERKDCDVRPSGCFFTTAHVFEAGQ